MRLLKMLPLVLFIIMAMSSVVVMAQGDAEALPFSLDWKYVIALFINSVLVVVAVQIIKQFLPAIPGGVKQILALVAGPLLMWASTAIGNALGYPIDFQPLIQLFTGLTSSLAAMGLFDVGKKVTSK
jgi:hypothetical protein